MSSFYIFPLDFEMNCQTSLRVWARMARIVGRELDTIQESRLKEVRPELIAEPEPRKWRGEAVVVEEVWSGEIYKTTLGILR